MLSTTRREFLIRCSAAAGTILPGWGYAEPLPTPSALEYPSFAAFAQQLYTEFLVIPDAGLPLPLELVRAEPAISSESFTWNAPDAQNEKFSLLFRGPLSPALEQDTYVFVHATLGDLAIFIVPLRCETPDFGLYEAVFNRAPNPEPSRHPSSRSVPRRPGSRFSK
jgi:hypothetical protein